MLPRHVFIIGSALLVGSLIPGCGGTAAPQPEAATAASASSQTDTATQPGSASPVIRPAGLTASIPQSDAKAPVDGSAEQGTTPRQPEFPDDEATQSLAEIQRLRIAAFPADVEAARKARRERNERIIDLATRAIRGTMNEDARSSQFDTAIKQLLEARFQTALTGSEEDIEALYSDVQALCDRDPKSPAAAEGVYTIARFAHTKAGLTGRTQPVWFETLSRWAREFADRFPEDQKRSTSLLFGAGRTCELHAAASADTELSSRLLTESRLCYTALAEKFPTSDQGQEATAALRRLALPGQILTQFSGPTSDGGYVSADDFKGKPTLIYFWDSQSDDFRDKMLPALARIREQLPPERLRIIGVALDEDESQLNTFLEQHAAPGQQVFFPQTTQRSWNSPLVRFWGLAASPTVWVLNADARVLSTNVTVEQLVPTLQQALRK
jgi:hypothetical protein